MKKLLCCITLLAATVMLFGCGSKQSVVLLPNLDGEVGEVVVTPKKGEAVTLDTAYQASDESGKISTLSEAEVQKTFGEALAAQPEPAVTFLLYFLFDSDRLTEESKAFLPRVLDAYRHRKSTDVTVVGHSDTMGDSGLNYRLSLKRAAAVVKLLVDEGVPAEVINTESHGEENPLVPTPDGVSEPRNRRVEVRVR